MLEQTPDEGSVNDQPSDDAIEETVAEDALVEETVAEAIEDAELAEEVAETVEAVEEVMEAVVAEAIAEELIEEGADPDEARQAAIEVAEEAVTPEMAAGLVAEALVEAVVEEVVEEVIEEAQAAEAAAEEAVVEEAIEVTEEAVVEEEIDEAAAEEAAAVEAERAANDPFRGPGDWYVVHTYAGYENKVKTNLTSRTQSMQMQDKIFDIHIPMEDVMEIKGGKKQVVKKKVFPGYLLVKMIYDNDSWYVVRNTPGVTGFVSSGTGTKPTPLSRKEIEKILVVQEEVVKPTFRLEFEEGDVVRIISGPFADFNGTINEINVDQSKLKVLVNIFDRETPVELGFDQVAKV